MSRIDAKDALAIYRHFCKQTERVVEYLGVARKLQNLLNVPIPNLRPPLEIAGPVSPLTPHPPPPPRPNRAPTPVFNKNPKSILSECQHIMTPAMD